MDIKLCPHGTTEQDILCPNCRRKIATYRGGSMPLDVSCKKCKILVRLNPEEGTTKIIPIPKRDSSSAMRFY